MSSHGSQRVKGRERVRVGGGGMMEAEVRVMTSVLASEKQCHIAKGCCCMSSSSLAFFNSFTLEEKQNKIPGDNYRLKLSPDKGKGVAISPGSEKPRQKPF